MKAPSRFELERLSDRTMPGFERAALGEWVLRAAVGATGRANTVWVTGSAGLSAADSVDVVEAWYADRGLRAGFQLFDGVDADVLDELARRGYEHSPGALVMWSPLERLSVLSRRDDVIEVSSELPADFAELIGDPGRVAEISRSEVPHVIATITDELGFIGGGKAAIDAEHVGIFSMLTAERARRTGIGTAIMGQLLAEAAAAGATSVWLQVMVENAPARAMYEAAGFETVHHYDYKFKPAG